MFWSEIMSQSLQHVPSIAIEAALIRVHVLARLHHVPFIFDQIIVS
jgi:hypothetical protein